MIEISNPSRSQKKYSINEPAKIGQGLFRLYFFRFYLFGFYVFFDTADLPWLDLKRKKVGKANKTTIAVRRMRLIVKLLTPSSADVKAKIIWIK